MDTGLKIYNTLSGDKQEFVPIGEPVKMYVCGMTPKNHPHIGHARLFVVMDMIRRYIEWKGYRIIHAQNFTDIDDKIIIKAAQEGDNPFALAQKYTDSYFESMDALNVQRAHLYPSVTKSMDDIIAIIEGLIEKDHAYAVNGNVWFSVDSFPEYGKLSHRTDEDVLAGARIEVDPDKRNPRDFALWKAAKPGEPYWESPWGNGRPGWHIECSTMVIKNLGDQIDIHGGGPDLVFPHHENEIAQSEAFTGKEPFAKYWPHIGQVNAPSGEKMAHSRGNFITIRDMLQVYPAAAVRLYFLQQHYRAPITFAVDQETGRSPNIDDATRALERLQTALRDVSGIKGNEPNPEASQRLKDATEHVRKAFTEGMDDDFNSAAALAALFDFVREINIAKNAGLGIEQLTPARVTLIELCGVLGVILQEPVDTGHDNPTAKPFIDLLVKTRSELRAAKQYALADKIRHDLADLGVALEDRPDGSTWRWEKA